MPVIVGWLINLLPLIWFLAAKGMPGLLKGMTTLSGRAGLVGKICGGIVWMYWFIRRLPIQFLKIKIGYGLLGKIFTGIRVIFGLFCNFPAIIFITLVGSQIFPSLLEKLFLLVGAVAVKIVLMIFTRVMSAMEDYDNMEQLNQIVGDSLDNMPPCLLDVLGYMHVVEDIGLIIGTLILLFTYKIVSAIAFKFVR